MRTAYSLFLREHVDPRTIGYDECRRFQIVCPACKEPVFRVSRRSADGEVAFFSHYRKDETVNEQCELRVNAISRETIAGINAESRNQKLHLFLRVFQDVVWAHEYNEETIGKAKQRFLQLGKSEVFAALVRHIFDRLRDTVADKNEIFDLFDESLENLPEFAGQYETTLRKEFAYDLLCHLLAGHSKANFLFLAKHACVLTVKKLEDGDRAGTLQAWELTMLEQLHRFLRSRNERKRLRILEEMQGSGLVSPYSHQDADLFVMFGSSLHYNAFGILMRLPYLDVLAAEQ